MAYDPNKKEVWLISVSGFWREGQVNFNPDYMIRAECTWGEAVKIMERWSSLETDHRASLDALEARHTRRMAAFRSDPLPWIST